MENLVVWMGPEDVRSITIATAAAATTTTGGGGESFEEVLHVFPMLESLIIEDCSKLTTAPTHFPSLKELIIKDNKHVSMLQNILLDKGISTSLSTLKINGMDGLICFSDILAAAGLPNNNKIIFQNLKDLSLGRCPNLTSISGWCGTCLESLDLFDCENLRELQGEDLFEFRSLRSLVVSDCPRIVIIPEALPKLTSLVSLWISGCNELKNLPCEMPKSLRSLSVFCCPNLVSFPLDLHQVPLLSWFELYRCPKLKTDMTPKGFGFLTNLWKVEIGPFSDDEENISSLYNELDWSGLESLSTLRQLVLYGLHHMDSLPHQLQYLTTLTELRIFEFGRIEALPDWIGNLQSLQMLYVCNCGKLGCLPSRDAMRRLTKLTALTVTGSPLLKERCSTTDSSEWSKIAHISSCRFH